MRGWSRGIRGAGCPVREAWEVVFKFSQELIVALFITR